MKKSFLCVVSVLLLSSCGTLFTSSKQDITFTGDPGIAVYDKGKKIAEIGNDGIGHAKIRKKLSDKNLIAKKEGYKNTPLQVETVLNPISILNLLCVPAWAVDLCTGKCCKWDNEIIEIEMKK